MAERNDLTRLAALHTRAFNRMRALEEKVALIQENAEEYSHATARWMSNLIDGLRPFGFADARVDALLDALEDSIPTMEHIHVYLWGAPYGLPRGVGECPCGESVEHPRAGTDDDLYDNSPGSSANRSGGRRRRGSLGYE